MYDSLDLVQEAPLPPSIDNRRHARSAVVMRAELRDPVLARHSVQVFDLSIAGFRCAADYSLDAGQRIWIKLPGLSPLEARVAWRRRDIIGATFVRPLYPAVFDHIIKINGVDA